MYVLVLHHKQIVCQCSEVQWDQCQYRSGSCYDIDVSISGSADGRRNIGPFRNRLGTSVPAAAQPATPATAAAAAPPELRLRLLRVSDDALAPGVHHVERLRIPPHDDAPLGRQRRRVQSQVSYLQLKEGQY